MAEVEAFVMVDVAVYLSVLSSNSTHNTQGIVEHTLGRSELSVRSRTELSKWPLIQVHLPEWENGHKYIQHLQQELLVAWRKVSLLMWRLLWLLRPGMLPVLPMYLGF